MLLEIAHEESRAEVGGNTGNDTGAETLVFDSYSAFVVTVLYLMLLGSLFSFAIRSIEKFRWVVPLAFCCSLLSVVMLNIALWICGVTVELDGP